MGGFIIDDDDGGSLFGLRKKAPFNGSFLVFGQFKLKTGFLDLVNDNGIRVSEVVCCWVTFKAEAKGLSFANDQDGDDNNNENEKVDCEVLKKLIELFICIS